MELSNFSTLIGIAVTLNIAFVAIEYVKTYAKVLCNQVFKMDEIIRDTFNLNNLRLVNRDTVWGLPSSMVDGKSTSGKIEEVKREWEKLNNEIFDKKQEFEREIETIWKLKNISAVGLWMFLYGVTALFLIGCVDIFDYNWLWLALTILTVGYSIIAWCLSDKLPVFNSLWSTIAIYAVALLVCIILNCVIGHVGKCIQGEILKTIVVLLSVAYQFSNFVALVCKVGRQLKKVKTDIELSGETLKKKCEKLNKKVEPLNIVSELSKQLNIDV